jgi:hypothetical protein
VPDDGARVGEPHDDDDAQARLRTRQLLRCAPGRYVAQQDHGDHAYAVRPLKDAREHDQRCSHNENPLGPEVVNRSPVAARTASTATLTTAQRTIAGRTAASRRGLEAALGRVMTQQLHHVLALAISDAHLAPGSPQRPSWPP